MRDAGDVYSLRNNFQRVFVTLLDGKWHGAAELQRVGGQNFGARVRELREDRCGNQQVECRKAPGKQRGSQYRINLQSLTDEWKDRILANDLAPRKRPTKTCPACNGKGTVPLTFQYAVPQDKAIDTFRWNDVFDELLAS